MLLQSRQLQKEPHWYNLLLHMNFVTESTCCCQLLRYEASSNVFTARSPLLLTALDLRIETSYLPILRESYQRFALRANVILNEFTKNLNHISFSCLTHNSSKTSWIWLFFTLILMISFFSKPVFCENASRDVTWQPASTLFPSVNSSSGGSTSQDPLSRLSKVFGISRIPTYVVHRTPPQYMTDLYGIVADRGGLTISRGPYNANTVRSFPDRGTIHEEYFFYNVSHLKDGVVSEERLLEAEFHIFKLKPRPSKSVEGHLPHHLQLKLHQVLNTDSMHSTSGLRLLDIQTISMYSHGWFAFKVTKAVQSWRNDQTTNHGLFLTAHIGSKIQYNGSYLRFAQRDRHHDSKQPILVVFADDLSMDHSVLVSLEDEDYRKMNAVLRASYILDEEKQRNEHIAINEFQREYNQFLLNSSHKSEVTTSGSKWEKNFKEALQTLNELTRNQSQFQSPKYASAPHFSNDRQKRLKRNTSKFVGESKSGRRKRKRQEKRQKRLHHAGGYRFRRPCSKHKMNVDFDEIGWSGWIISPKGYDAYHCSGDCPFPLGQSQKPTNHATVQSIVHALRVNSKTVGTPCCVPNKLFSISLLYFDDDENVILKQYDDMVAASCACH